MPAVDSIYEQVMPLPDESKIVLAERIMDYLAVHISPDIEHLHLEEVQRRSEEIKSGRVKPIPGEEALAKVREIINK